MRTWVNRIVTTAALALAVFASSRAAIAAPDCACCACLGRYQRPATQGEPAAQLELARCFDASSPRVGCGHDPGKASYWLSKAAASGSAEAQYLLGWDWMVGNLHPENPTEAAKWWARAAQRSYAPAEHDLATLYEDGIGLPRDPERARAWLTQAAALGEERALDRTQRSRRPPACGADVARLCADRRSGDDLVRERCLLEHRNRLSAVCLKGLERARERYRLVYASCERELLDDCPTTPKTLWPATLCLKQQRPERLSSSCRAALGAYGQP